MYNISKRRVIAVVASRNFRRHTLSDFRGKNANILFSIFSLSVHSVASPSLGEGLLRINIACMTGVLRSSEV